MRRRSPDKINRLVDFALEIERESAIDAKSFGLMPPSMVQATIPHREIFTNEFSRTNGNFTLTIIAPSHIGLPYGSIPRILIAWLTTEICQTKQREIFLGENLSAFMRKLDLVSNGGGKGGITSLKKQIKRLFSSQFTVSYDDGNTFAINSAAIANSAFLCWQPINTEETTPWQPYLLVGEQFYKEAIHRPFPVDMRAIKALRQSPMALDIYCWLTYRMVWVKRPTPISWEGLRMQLGASYKDSRQGKYNFRKAFKDHLESVLTIYPRANVEVLNEGICLRRSPPHVPFKRV